MMNLNKLKLIGESLKSYPLIIIIGVVGTITILLFADKIPNLILIIQLWAILTAYIILFIQIKREKKKSQKAISITISQIEDLLYYMHVNDDKLIKLQNETKNKLKILRIYYSENLSKINCFFTSNLTELFILTEKYNYYINPVQIKRMEKDISTIITKDKKDIDRIIKELRALI